MQARRQDEVLEECLSAYLEGRRSIEESLSLYPSLAGHIEPLLRASIGLADTLQQPLLPFNVQEQARDRFLVAASSRRTALALLRSMDLEKRVQAEPWRAHHWGALVGGVLAGFALLMAAGTMVSDGGSDSGPFRVTVTLRELRAEQAQIRAGAGESIPTEAIRSLTATTERLATQVQEPASVPGLEQALREQFALLLPYAATQSDAEEAVALTERLATGWGIALPFVSPLPTPVETTPEATPGEMP